jgi:hypothetical protein
MVILVGGTGLFVYMPHLNVFTNFYCDTEYIVVIAVRP